MDAASAIGVIAQVLSLSGLVSIRMFLPVFLYFAMMRLAAAFPAYAPEMLITMAEKVPDWQLSWPFLVVFGLLAGAELAAVRNPDIKQFLTEDLDRYAKPVMTILLASSVINTAQSEEVRQLFQVQQAGIGTFGVILTLTACSLTATMCHLRSVLLEKIYALDPDSSIGLQNTANYTEEVMLACLLLLLFFVPMLALFLTLCGLCAGVLFKKIQLKREKKHSHGCPACQQKQQETLVSNSAVICQVCGADQPEIHRVGWLGLTSATPLGRQSLLQHRCRLLAAKRCCWCAQPLKGATSCSVCGRKQWQEDELVRLYLRKADLLGLVLLGISVLSFLWPIVGCALVMIFFRPLVLRPLAIHLSGAGRLWIAFLTMMFKIAATGLLLLLALLPGIGLIFILPFFVRYLLVRRKFCKVVRAEK